MGWGGWGREGCRKETSAKALVYHSCITNKNITPAFVTPLKLTHQWQKEVMSSISSPEPALLLPLSRLWELNWYVIRSPGRLPLGGRFAASDLHICTFGRENHSIYTLVVKVYISVWRWNIFLFVFIAYIHNFTSKSCSNYSSPTVLWNYKLNENLTCVTRNYRR